MPKRRKRGRKNRRKLKQRVFLEKKEYTKKEVKEEVMKSKDIVTNIVMNYEPSFPLNGEREHMKWLGFVLTLHYCLKKRKKLITDLAELCKKRPKEVILLKYNPKLNPNSQNDFVLFVIDLHKAIKKRHKLIAKREYWERKLAFAKVAMLMEENTVAPDKGFASHSWVFKLK